MLSHVDHSRAGTVVAGRLRERSARHYLRFQIGRLGSREVADREDALRRGGRRLRSLQRFRTPAHRRDAGATRPRQQLAAVHAAPAAHSAGNSLHHLREVGETRTGGRTRSVSAPVLRGQALGARYLARPSCPRSSSRSTRITATSVSRFRRMARGRCWCRASTTY